MSLFGGITDFLTGGANQQAEQALNEALKVISAVRGPSKEDLTLPELQKYVQMGLLTPSQAEAVLQQTNAYDSIDMDPRARETSIDALTKLSEIGMSGGHDANSEAALYDTQSRMNQTLAGQRGSIMDQMAQRGIPTSLMGVSAQLAAAGQDAEIAHKDALQVNADAETRALAALEASGTMGNQISGQQFNEASTKAAAQNAIDQWNAANQTNMNAFNAGARDRAATFNKQNEQGVSNANVQNTNARTQYNTQLPQQIYNNEMEKANALAGIYGKQATNYARVGEQNAGTAGAIIGAASTAAGGMAGAPPVPGAGTPGGASVAPTLADMGPVMMASSGGRVPGHAQTPGNSPANDKVPAMLSPGEVVIPRTAAHSPDLAAQFVRHLHRNQQRTIHPEDVKAVLEALTSRRHGG